MNGVISILGLGLIAAYFIQNNNNLKEALDDVRGKLEDAQDTADKALENYEKSETNAIQPGTIKYYLRDIASTLELVFGFNGSDQREVCVVRYNMAIKNLSDSFSYKIKKLKVHLFLGDYPVELFVPGDKREMIVRPGATYKMDAVQDGEQLFSDYETIKYIYQDLVNSGNSIPFVDRYQTDTWKEIKKYCTADVIMEVEKANSNSPILVEFNDVPVTLKACAWDGCNKKKYMYGWMEGGDRNNALTWEESELNFDDEYAE